ncbi:ATP-binding cassette domain-containing protein [Streptomyces anulatus]
MGHRYGLRGAWVLRGVDLTLPERTLVRVEGGNGAGKSTLLRLLAGIDAPAEGRITGRRARTAALAGLPAVLCCVLLGAAVGALSTRPVPLRRGWSVAAAVLGSVLALVTTGSPARHAVTALVTGSRTGTVQPPVLPLLGAVVLAAAAAFLVCRTAARRG